MYFAKMKGCMENYNDKSSNVNLFFLHLWSNLCDTGTKKTAPSKFYALEGAVFVSLDFQRHQSLLCRPNTIIPSGQSRLAITIAAICGRRTGTKAWRRT